MGWFVLTAAVLALLVVGSGSAAQLPGNETDAPAIAGTWADYFIPPGVAGVSTPIVEALAGDQAGNLYVAGQFATAGGVSANNIAMWDGSSWSALGSGMGDRPDDDYYVGVFALAVDSADNLTAVGASRIAKWDFLTCSSDLPGCS